MIRSVVFCGIVNRWVAGMVGGVGGWRMGEEVEAVGFCSGFSFDCAQGGEGWEMSWKGKMWSRWGCGQVVLAIVEQEVAGVGRDVQGKVRCCGLYGADYRASLFVMVQILVFLFVDRISKLFFNRCF